MTNKVDASSINTNDIPHPNMSPLTPKAVRLKGKNMLHHKQQHPCTQSHAYPLTKSMSSITSTYIIDLIALHEAIISQDIRCILL